MASARVSIRVDGQDRRISLAQPEITGQVPGLLVTVGAFGVNKHTQEVTDKLAHEGYAAVAPVLYHRLGSNPLFSYVGDDAEVHTKATAGAFHWHSAGERPFALRTCSARCWGISAHSTGARRPTKCAGSEPNRKHTAESAIPQSTQAPTMASTVMSARATMPRLHRTPGGERSGGFSDT
jgi:Dienelactone hydrolase family